MWRGKGAFKGFLKRAETGARQEKNKPTFSSSATKKHVKAPVVTFPRRKEHRWSFSPPTLPLLKETLLAFERHSCLLPSSSSFSSSSFRSRLKREKPNIPPRAPAPASPLASPFPTPAIHTTRQRHQSILVSEKKWRNQTQAPTGKGPPRPGREAFKPYTPGKGREPKKTFDTLPPFSSGSASRLHPTARATKVGLAGTRGELVIQRGKGGGLKEEEGEAHKQSDGGKGARL